MKQTTPFVLLATFLLAFSAAAAALTAPARMTANPTLSAQAPENFTLWGDTLRGFGFTQMTIQTPGPTLTVKQGVQMNLTLYSNDTATHTFCIDYDNDGSCTGTTDWISSSFSSSTMPVSVSYAPTTAGTFHYYCSFHYGAMTGTIVIQGTGGSGMTPATDYTPYIVVIVIIVVVAIAVAVVLRRKPKAPQQPPTNP